MNSFIKIVEMHSFLIVLIYSSYKTTDNLGNNGMTQRPTVSQAGTDVYIITNTSEDTNATQNSSQYLHCISSEDYDIAVILSTTLLVLTLTTSILLIAILNRKSSKIAMEPFLISLALTNMLRGIIVLPALVSFAAMKNNNIQSKSLICFMAGFCFASLQGCATATFFAMAIDGYMMTTSRVYRQGFPYEIKSSLAIFLWIGVITVQIIGLSADVGYYEYDCEIGMCIFRMNNSHGFFVICITFAVILFFSTVCFIVTTLHGGRKLTKMKFRTQVSAISNIGFRLPGCEDLKSLNADGLSVSAFDNPAYTINEDIEGFDINLPNSVYTEDFDFETRSLSDSKSTSNLVLRTPTMSKGTKKVNADEDNLIKRDETFSISSQLDLHVNANRNANSPRAVKKGLSEFGGRISEIDKQLDNLSPYASGQDESRTSDGKNNSLRTSISSRSSIYSRTRGVLGKRRRKDNKASGQSIRDFNENTNETQQILKSNSDTFNATSEYRAKRGENTLNGQSNSTHELNYGAKQIQGSHFAGIHSRHLQDFVQSGSKQRISCISGYQTYENTKGSNRETHTHPIGDMGDSVLYGADKESCCASPCISQRSDSHSLSNSLRTINSSMSSPNEIRDVKGISGKIRNAKRSLEVSTNAKSPSSSMSSLNTTARSFEDTTVWDRSPRNQTRMIKDSIQNTDRDGSRNANQDDLENDVYVNDNVEDDIPTISLSSLSGARRSSVMERLRQVRERKSKDILNNEQKIKDFKLFTRSLSHVRCCFSSLASFCLFWGPFYITFLIDVLLKLKAPSSIKFSFFWLGMGDGFLHFIIHAGFNWVVTRNLKILIRQWFSL